MTSQRSAAWWLNFGAAVEYYDFVVYAMLAPVLGAVFFNKFAHPTVLALSVFLISYISRPVGGFLFALFGDKYGRRPSLLASSALLAAATILLALTPTGNTSSAIAWLLSCRLLQGLCWGAEVPGVSTIIFENKSRHLYFNNALLIMSIGIGALAGGVVVAMLQHTYAHTEIIAQMWRAPFAGGAVLALMTLFLRRRLRETAQFSATNPSQQTALPLRAILQSVSWQLPVSILIFIIIMLPSVFSALKLASFISIAIAWSCFMLPLAGWLYDLKYRRELYITSVMCSCASVALWIAFYNTANKSFLLAAMLCIETIIAILTPRALVQISAAFATAKRLTGVSVAYNISYLLASCMPLIILACGEVRSLAIIILLTINLVIVTIRFKPKELHVSNS